MSEQQQLIRVDVDAERGVANVTLNRPEKRNALTADMMETIANVYDELGARADIKVVIIAGAGVAFCGGADRTAYPGGLSVGPFDGDRHRALKVGERLVQAIQGCSAVTIARLHGHVVGGGMVIALACDVRIAADTAALSLPETAIGLPLAWSATPLVVDEVGPLLARELILLGRVFAADEALDAGMLNRVVPEAALDATVAGYVHTALQRDLAAIVTSKVQFAALRRGRAVGDITAFDSLLLHYSTQLDAVRNAFGAEPLSTATATKPAGESERITL